LANDDKRRVLLTGAGGRIGTNFRREMGDRYALRLAERDPAALGDAGGHETVAFDIADPERCRRACAGIDTVVHLAADPSPRADFYGSLLDNNIKGVFNIFRAAKDAGCRRVIFASSINVIGGYPADVQVSPEGAIRPPNMYGVSKAFGEATAHYFAHAEGLSAICIRIGHYDAGRPDTPVTTARLAAYVSPRDLNALIVGAIETPGVTFAIVNGLSDNRYKRMDISSARDLLGYAPQDDAFRIFAINLPEE
jgi:NAD+ dependent glucose-6-phosphate dehydrogenase